MRETSVRETHNESQGNVEACDVAVVEASVGTGTKAIVHLAAQTQVLRSIEDPQGTFDNNVVVTGALLERARQVS